MKDEKKTKAQLIAELQDLRRKLSIDADSDANRAPEETSRGSEKKYQRLFEAASDAIFLLCRETLAIMDVNPAAVALYQYRREEMLRMTALQFSAEPEKSRQMMQDKSGKAPLLNHRKKDGTIFPVEILYHDFDYQGHPVRIATIRDITERKQAEAALVESEKNLRTFFNTIDNLLFVLDSQANILEINAAVTQKLGYTPEELQGRSVLIIHPPERWDEAQRIISEMLTGKADYCPIPVLTKAGRQIPVETRVIPGNWSGQDVIFGVTKDLSAIKASEEKFASVFQLNPSPSAISEVDTGQFIAVNASFLQILGYTPEQVIGRTSMELNIFADANQRADLIEKMQTQGFLRNENALVLTRTGEVRNGIFSAAYIHLQDRTLLLTVMEDVTERVKAEENFQRVFQANPVAQLVVEADTGRIMQANAAFCRQTGFLRDELISHTTPELNLWSEPSWQQVIVQQLRTGRQVTNIEADFRIKSGEIRTSLVSFEPVELDGVRCIISSLLDITERKQAEEKLRASEEKYRGIFDGSVAAIYLFDQTKRFIGSNQAGLNLLGYSHEELMKMSIPEVDANPMIVLPAHTKLLSGGRLINYEHKLRRKDQSIITVLNNSIPLTDSTGNIIGMLSTLLDITERKQAEDALRESEIKYRTLIQQAGDAIYLLYHHRFELINEKFQEMFGLSPEVIRQPDFDFINLVAPKSRPLVEERMRRLAVGEKLEPNYEFTALNAQGKELEVEASVTYIKYKDGIATQGIIRDVTARKLLEEQVRHTQKLETIGTLAGGIAHAFNNLLTPILGYTDLAIDSLAPTDPLTEDLGQVITAANRAKELVEQILIFSRRRDDERQPVSLHLIVQEVVKLLRPSIPSTIGIRQRINFSCDKVLANASEMHQVIMNLCTNAFQAMQKEGGTLTIELQPVKVDRAMTKIYPALKEADYVRLSITDTGTGMEAAILNRIFEPFFTTKAPGEGAGMGLSVVHGIVRSHYGDVIVTSKPGEGSTFHVYLPTTKAEWDDEIKPQTTIEHGHESILIVDDEIAILGVLKKILKRLGYQVDGYHSSIEALKMYQVQPSRYNLVISDLTMPGLTGLALAKQLHTIDKEVPIIIMTGYGESVSLEIRKEHGICNIIGKPIAIENLASIIRKTLGK